MTETRSRARRALAALLAGLLLAGLPLAHGASAGDHAETGELAVTITALRSDKGRVTVFLWRPEDDFADPEDAFVISSARPAGGTAEAVFADLPPGRYGLASYHDENANGELDQNWIGWPTEGIGFSRGARISLAGPPAFDRTAIEVVPGRQRIELPLRY